jgi:PiT family inorganic phosphate transporter
VSGGDIILALVVVTALGFDFTNGFHDTANAMATTIATGALKPKVAVTIAAILNFVGAFISLEVAATVAGGIVDAGAITPTVVLGGLIGAIAWNLGTWWFGLPSSSSHALIGGVIGATFVASGSGAIEGEGILSKVIVPAVLSPIVAGLVAALGVFLVYRIIKRFVIERAERQFRWAQVASSSMVALAHGTNDAQKTMGVISLALIANGNISGGDNFDVPTWVVVSCAAAIALGTYTGGWRIIKTLGTKVVEVRPPQGFGSEAVAATVILASSHVGYPLSTTQVVSGAVTGSGVGRPGAAVNWAVRRTAGRRWRPRSRSPSTRRSARRPRARSRWRHERARVDRGLGLAVRGGLHLGRRRARGAAGGRDRRRDVAQRGGRADRRQRRRDLRLRRCHRAQRARPDRVGRRRHLLPHAMSDAPFENTRPRPVPTVLDTLRARIDHDDFDAAVFWLESVVADLGYGDVRALPGSVAWIDRLRDEGKKLALAYDGERADAALEIAGIADRFDAVVRGPRSAATVARTLEALGAPADRAVVVDVSATGLEAGVAAGAVLAIAVARGSATPEQLRRSGATTVVADLQELVGPT